VNITVKIGKLFISLRIAIIAFTCCILLFALSITGVLIGHKEAENVQGQLSQKVMIIAQVFANTPEVIHALEGTGSKAAVQSLANQLLQTTKVKFIVVMNMKTVRLSHPNIALIGKKFVGGDEYPALHGKTYVSEAHGTLGTSLRAFVPIRGMNGKEIGVVSVGILVRNVHSAIARSEDIIYFGIAVGLFAGIVGAIALAASIKKVLFGLEPVQIANLIRERSAMLESVREGILAINQQGKITLINSEAIQMIKRLGVYENPTGQDVDMYLPNFRLGEVLTTGQDEFAQEFDVSGTTFIVNRVPIRVQGKVVGAIATFRDKTEFKKIAEQLTGVKLYAEALRVQSHEFINKLHVILGMIHTQQYEELSKYIQNITDYFLIEVGSISKQIQNPVLAGFLLSKLSYAREQQVLLQLEIEGVIPTPEGSETIDDIITVVGNLIDNSIEAAQQSVNKHIHVTLRYADSKLKFHIRDNGGGISDEHRDCVFDKGFSIKGSGRGYGLFLVRQKIDKSGGIIQLKSGKNWTSFEVEIPYNTKEGTF